MRERELRALLGRPYNAQERTMAMAIEAVPSTLTVDYLAGVKWIGSHIAEVAQKHPNQWVGVHINHVFAANDELGRVVDEAPVGVPIEDLVFQFVDDGTLIFSF